MKLKYYLRTLGLAIMVTTLILSVSSNAAKGKQEAMSDAQIRARAIELGMVDSGSLMLSDLIQKDETGQASGKDAQQGASEQAKDKVLPAGDPEENGGVSEEVSASGDTQSGESATDSSTDENAESVSTLPSDTGETSGEGQPEEDAYEENPLEYVMVTEENVIVTILRGESSESVSRALAEAGLVADAGAYDKYLCTRGFDKSIRAGVYVIPKGASEEEITRMIIKEYAIP